MDVCRRLASNLRPSEGHLDSGAVHPKWNPTKPTWNPTKIHSDENINMEVATPKIVFQGAILHFHVSE